MIPLQMYVKVSTQRFLLVEIQFFRLLPILSCSQSCAVIYEFKESSAVNRHSITKTKIISFKYHHKGPPKI